MADLEQQLRDLFAEDAADLGPGAATRVAWDPRATPAPRPRRWWTLVAAAVCMAAVLGITALVVGTGSSYDQPPSSPPATETPAEVVDRLSVPTVLGLDGSAAEALLRERGLDVGMATQAPGCGEPDGMALGTDPVAGAAIRPGQQVRLAVVDGSGPLGTLTIPCVQQRAAWALMRLSLGVGDGPTFADVVSIRHLRTETDVPRDALAGSPAWQAVLDRLRSDLSRNQLVIGGGVAGYRLPIVTFLDGAAVCGSDLSEQRDLVFDVTIPIDGARICSRYGIDFDDDGRVRAIVELLAPQPRNELEPPATTLPVFARGGPPADFGPTVPVYVDGVLVATLTGTEPTERDGWGEASAVLNEIADSDLVDGPDPCPGRRTATYPGVVRDLPIDLLHSTDCADGISVVLLVRGGGTIQGIALEHAGYELVAVPAVVDQVPGPAGAAIRRADLVPRFRGPCAPVVVAQNPPAGTLVTHGATVTLIRGDYPISSTTCD